MKTKIYQLHADNVLLAAAGEEAGISEALLELGFHFIRLAANSDATDYHSPIVAGQLRLEPTGKTIEHKQ